MLTEYLHSIQWHQTIPGIHAACFSVDSSEDGFPAGLPVALKPSHFEVLFCCSGSLLLGLKNASPISVGPQEILLLSDCSNVSSAQITSPLEGVCLSIDTASIQESPAVLSGLVGDSQLHIQNMGSIMEQHDGCIRLHSLAWNRTLFSALSTLAVNTKPHYCTIKYIELLYLMCAHSLLLREERLPVGYLTNTVAEMQSYMENHLDEKLTIPSMCQRFNISPTAFKSCFRSIYGLPVHTWLQARRMQRATEFLIGSPMTVLQVAQAVGYDGVSQFNVVFKHRYGMTPSQYRKMSNSAYSKQIP